MMVIKIAMTPSLNASIRRPLISRIQRGRAEHSYEVAAAESVIAGMTISP